MLKDINPDKKVDILLSALEERYQSIREIRNRVQSTGVWFLGVMGVIGGWLFQSEVALGCLQKNIYILAIVVIFIVVRFIYLKDLNIGFKGQQRAAVKLENALGLFIAGFFEEGGNPIYEELWKKAGTEKGEGNFFRTTYALMYTGAAFLILAILFKGCFYVIIQ